VEGFSPGGVRAHTVEVHPGVTKIVMRGLSTGVGSDDGAAAFKLALRVGGTAPFALPSSASICPASSAARSAHRSMLAGRRTGIPVGEQPARRHHQ
jgi:hypothetical protein